MLNFGYIHSVILIRSCKYSSSECPFTNLFAQKLKDCVEPLFAVLKPRRGRAGPKVSEPHRTHKKTQRKKESIREWATMCA